MYHERALGAIAGNSRALLDSTLTYLATSRGYNVDGRAEGYCFLSCVIHIQYKLNTIIICARNFSTVCDHFESLKPRKRVFKYPLKLWQVANSRNFFIDHQLNFQSCHFNVASRSFLTLFFGTLSCLASIYLNCVCAQVSASG